MANLAKCADCKLLTLNTDEDISAHRLWHKDWDAKFRNTRTAATEARDALHSLREQIRGYGDQLSAHPITEPEQITVDDFDLEDEDASDDAIDSLVQSNYEDRISDGQDDDDDYPPAIDREDDLDTRLANATGTIPPLGPLA
jgi:hypothetical protein